MLRDTLADFAVTALALYALGLLGIEFLNWSPL